MDDFTLQSIQRQMPMFGAATEPRSGLDFNLPGIGNDPVTGLLGNLASTSLMRSLGMAPSQMYAQQNVFDQYVAKAYTDGKEEAAALGAAADRQTVVDVMRGVARLTGTPFTLEKEKAAQSLAGGFAKAAPFLSQLFPDMFDSLHGSRGSAAVMSQSIFRGGLSAQDAATGLTGLSGKSAGAIAASLQSHFFGPDADIGAFRGLSMGRLGMLYEDIQSRGLAGPSIATHRDSPHDELAELSSDTDFVTAAMGKLRTTNPAAHARLLATADSADAASRAATLTASTAVIDAMKAADPGGYGRLATRPALRRPLAYLPESRQLDELAGIAATGPNDPETPAEVALSRLSSDAFGNAVTRFEQRTGRSLAGKTTAERRYALAGDRDAATEALTSLKGSDRAAFDSLTAGRRSGVENVKDLTTDSLRIEELSRSPAAVREAIAALKANDPTRHAQYEASGLLDRALAAGPESGIKGLAGSEQDKRLAETQKIAAETLAQIKKDVPEAFDMIRRDFDGKKIGERLKNLSGAVTAMRDVFGDMGHPDAPMRQLVEGLNQLTQGGLATQGTAELEKSVRLTQALAKSTGLGMDGMMGLMARGAGMADRMGIEREFAVQATQGAAAFGAAVGQVGRGDMPHFQAASREKMTLLDQQLRVQAAGSGMANQLNTALRLVDTMTDQHIAIGGPLTALTAAVKAGNTTFRNPATGVEESVFQSEADFRRTAMLSGVSDVELTRTAQQAATNRQYGAKYHTADLTRLSQASDIKGFVTQAHRAPVVDMLRAAGVGGDEAEDLGMTAATAAADTLMTLDSGILRSDPNRNAAVAAAIRGNLKARGFDVGKLDDRGLLRVADSGFGALNETVHDNAALRAYDTGLTMLEMNNKRLQARQRNISEENQITGLMRSTLSGIGQAGPIANVIDAIQSGSGDITEFAGRALGGKPSAEVIAKLDALKTMTPSALADAGITNRDQLVVMTTQLGKVLAKFDKAKTVIDPKERKATLDRLQKEASALVAGRDGATTTIDAMLSTHGLHKSDLGAAIRGEQGNFSADEIETLRALSLASQGGIAQTAAEAGLAVGGRVGKSQLDEAIGAAGRLAKPGDAAGRERHAAAFAAGLDTVVDGLLGDTSQIKALGAGGLTAVRDLRAKRLQLQAIADRDTGGDITKLLVSPDQRVSALRDAIASDLRGIEKKQTSPTTMGRREQDAVDEYGTALAVPDSDKNRALVERLLRETGGGRGSLSEAEREQLAVSIGEGKSGAAVRDKLVTGLDARAELERMAKTANANPADVRSAARGNDDASLSRLLPGADRGKLESLISGGGSLLRPGRADEGISFRAYRDSIEGAKAQAAEGSNQPVTTKISGRVTIENGRDIVFSDVRGESTGIGSTPVTFPI